MPRPRQIDPAALTLRFQARGPRSAQALATHLRVADSDIRRELLLPKLQPHLVRLGFRRGATYALRRSIRALGDTFPLRRIDSAGRPQDWAEITALHGGWRLAWINAANPPAWPDQFLGVGGFSEGFPFFLSAVRPQGFLGRAVARALPPTLGLDPYPRHWPTDDDTLVYLASEGDDVSGDLVAGGASPPIRSSPPPSPPSQVAPAKPSPASAQSRGPVTPVTLPSNLSAHTPFFKGAFRPDYGFRLAAASSAARASAWASHTIKRSVRSASGAAVRVLK